MKLIYSETLRTVSSVQETEANSPETPAEVHLAKEENVTSEWEVGWSKQHKNKDCDYNNRSLKLKPERLKGTEINYAGEKGEGRTCRPCARYTDKISDIEDKDNRQDKDPVKGI